MRLPSLLCVLATGFAVGCDGCGDDPASLVFVVQPDVITTDMTTTLRIYYTPGASDDPDPTSVYIRMHGTDKKIALTNVKPIANHENQIEATITAGQAGAGSYDVIVSDGGMLADGLIVVDSPDITITKVDPPFGAPTQDTAISITTSGYALADTPRVYLLQGGTATELRAVALEGPTSLSAIVPANTLGAGDYDVVVADPIDPAGGHVAVLAGGFHLIDNPPVMLTVTPQTVNASTTTPLAVAGSGFAASPTAWLQSCSAPAGVVPPTTPFALPAVTGVSGSALTVTIPGGTMAAGVACVLRVVNGAPADANNPCPPGGTCLPYADFSAVASVVNSGNLGDFAAAAPSVSPMSKPRRALGAVAGRASGKAKFLYALGGDDGTATNAYDDVEATQLDPVGVMLGWTAQRHAMTAKRTQAATVRVGQFIYAIGGTDGANAHATVERARILDPLDVPQVPDLDLVTSTDGVGAGTWVYKVTGVRDAAYPSDPGGETLPSDPLSITLPDLSGNDNPLIKVKLTWPQLADVVSYNIYRTPASGQSASQVELIGNVPAGTATTVSFEDTGLDSMGTTPLPIGSLGTWHATSALTVARTGAAAVAARGPSDATTETWFLYVAGGANSPAFGGGSHQDSYEWARIDIDKASGAQTVGAFTAGAAIGGGRAFLSAYAVDHTIKTNIPDGTTYVYFGTGQLEQTGANKVQSTVVGSVTTTSSSGDLGTLQTVSSANVSAAGYATITGYLFTFGGFVSAATIANTNAAALCPAAGCGAGTVPEVTTWNNGGGGTPITPRVMLGTVIDDPFIYILGGATGTGTTATASTERTVW